ncbi:MAG: VCBS repeat-containing protein [Gemmatimonadota bacterium]|nr:VCBS repeat-containing protein [Gemmatimonadota bacterium]
MRIRKLATTLVGTALVGLFAWFAARAVLDAPADAAASPTGPVAAETDRSGGISLGANQQAAEGFEWHWVINGPNGADGADQLSVDAEGNVFIAGYHGGLDYDWDGVVEVESGGSAVYRGARNSFFMKLSRGPSDDRVRVRWTRTPHTPADRFRTQIAADGRGGAYVKGDFRESLSFEGGPTLQGAGSNDAYIARLDPDGEVLWLKLFGGPEDGDVIYGLASDAEANAYVVVTGTGPFPMDDAGVEFPGSGGRSSGIVAYAPDGSVRWMHAFGPAAPDPRGIPSVLPVHVVTAPNGEIWAIGQFDVAADFDGDGAADLPAPRDRDGFVARFDPGGAFLGAWSIGVPGVATFGPGGDFFLASMVGGQMEQAFGPADFDGDGRADVEPRGGEVSSVVARFSPEGDLRWVRSYALETPADLEFRDGRLALSGSYRGLRDIDEDGMPEKRLEAPDLADEETDLAILILSAEDGSLERVWTAPGPGRDGANSVAFSPTEPALYVAGSIQLSVDFTGNGELDEGWVECDNLGDIFFAQYRLGEPPEEIVRERPERTEITLEAVLSERETRHVADLAWSGSTAERMDVYRNGELITTIPNDGSYTDVLPREREGVTGRPEYRVCEAGTTTCSGTVEARASPRS